MKPDRESGVLFSSGEIGERIRQMVEAIEQDYREKDLVVVAVLKGSVLFLADLVRGFSRPLAFDFIGVSSYGHSRTSLGVINLEKEISIDIRDKDVLVVDDILDSGRTLGWVKEHLTKFNPRTVKICVLLQKEVRRVIDVRADYIGFEIPDVFIYGYGLDYRDRYRHLPYIAQLSESEVPPGERMEE
ncbi:MAG: hypoxanthine phosphoribosyltransferase [Candidatus Erginobacter occultus]|nr:hypoxanthine phosphoribosyltransferase [Candidatus Erginobacter occultus]